MGRFKIKQDPYSIQFTVPMSEFMYNFISEESTRLNMSRAELVRQCLLSYIKRTYETRIINKDLSEKEMLKDENVHDNKLENSEN